MSDIPKKGEPKKPYARRKFCKRCGELFTANSKFNRVCPVCNKNDKRGKDRWKEDPSKVCKFIKKNGMRCRNHVAMQGYCYMHNSLMEAMRDEDV